MGEVDAKQQREGEQKRETQPKNVRFILFKCRCFEFTLFSGLTFFREFVIGSLRSTT